MPRFIYDIIPPGIKRRVAAATQEVSKWIKILRLFFKTSKYGTLILIVVIIGFGALLVWAFSPETETIEIFPTQYETEADSETNWQNGEKALQRNLSEEATLAEFSSENSANLFSIKEEITESEEAIEGGEVMGASEEEALPEEIEEPKAEEPQIEEPPIEEPEPKEQIQDEQQEQLPEENESQEEETELNLIEFWKQLGINIGGEEEIVSETEEVEEMPSEEVILEENINEEITTESETKEDADELLNLLEEVEEAEEIPSISEPVLIMHPITFSGFGSEQTGSLKGVKLMFSWAAEKRIGNEILLIEYKISENEWQTLALIQLNREYSNLSNNGYWQEEIPDITSWEDLEGLEVRFTVQSINVESGAPVYLDAVWLEVEYGEPEEEKYELTLDSKKITFKIDEELKFKFLFQRRLKKNILSNLIPGGGDKGEVDNIKIIIVDINGRISDAFRPKIQNQTEGEFEVVLEKINSYYFQPGKYRMRIEIKNGEDVFAKEQEFTWGVLAINTNKSIYLPNEQAYLQMAALKDDGHTLCDANLRLEILAPNGNTENPEVQKSDKCGPNNVVDVPDYFAYYQVGEVGIYQMKLTNLDNGYEITDSFEVRESVPFDVERIGPTRIYPPADYQMALRVKANQDFVGEVIESIPGSFDIKSQILDSRFQILDSKIVWQVDWKAGEIYELKYQFDAPDISPYLYLIGPLKIGDFQEIRQWQIAADTVARMILLWDNGSSLPTGWTCISCSGGDNFYQRFIRGSDSYGVAQGGVATHTHTDPGALTLNATAAAGQGAAGTLTSSKPYTNTHQHTVSAASINPASGLQGNNLPAYRTLRVIRYDNGIPDILPAGVIAIFDASPPDGWTAVYNDAATPRYIEGDNTVGTTGGSNTHVHSLTVKTTTGISGTTANRGSGGTTPRETHTHAFTAQNTSSGTSEPPYVNVALAQKDSAGSIPTDMIAMFDATPPAGQWSAQSGSGNPFYQRFFRPTNSSLGTTSDVSTHVHTATTFTSDGPSTATRVINATGSTFPTTSHTHTVSISLDSQSHTPVYWDALFYKATATPVPNLTQIYYHWRNDDNNEANATSATNGSQNTSLDSFNSSQNKRLRIEISNEGSAASGSVGFLLEYGLKETDCSAISTWVDVGANGGDWDMFPTINLTDGNNTTNITDSNKGAVSDGNPTFKSSNAGVKDTSSLVAAMALTYEDYAEMEFSIKPNVALGTYCFRVTDGGSTTNFTYTVYPEATLVHPPTIGEVSLNSKGSITLIENSQVDISASASVTDANGCSDIKGVKAIVYRYDDYNASCSEDPFDPNNCYGEDLFNCVTDGACSSNTQDYNCYASASANLGMEFFADPTDAISSFSTDEWVVTVIASDSYWVDVSSNSYDDNDEPAKVEVNTLLALEVTAGDPIQYNGGSPIVVGQNTGSTNETVTIQNTGNRGMDIKVYGTDLTGTCGTITVGNQQYASTSFTYNDYGKILSVNPGERYYNGSISWIKPTSATPVSNDVYWGIAVPEGTGVGVCSGTNTFSVTAEQ